MFSINILFHSGNHYDDITTKAQVFLIKEYLLCQSPLNKVCLFCVCTRDRTREHQRKHGTKAERFV